MGYLGRAVIQAAMEKLLEQSELDKARQEIEDELYDFITSKLGHRRGVIKWELKIEYPDGEIMII